MSRYLSADIVSLWWPIVVPNTRVLFGPYRLVQMQTSCRFVSRLIDCASGVAVGQSLLSRYSSPLGVIQLSPKPAMIGFDLARFSTLNA